MNRDDILQYAAESYGTEPEYLWMKFPRYAVLRHRENAKWYAAIMDVSKEKLGFSEEGAVDILNVKCEPAQIGGLLKKKGFLPAYHMNKENWLTILLDGSVPDEELIRLLEHSYDLTKTKRRKKTD